MDKIKISSDQITNLAIKGDAKNILDDDIKSSWFPGWDSALFYPAQCIIDLRALHIIKNVEVYDGPGIWELTVEFGTDPFNYQKSLVVKMEQYMKMQLLEVNTKARYIRLTMPKKGNQLETFNLYGKSLTPATAFSSLRKTKKEQSAVDKIIGATSFYWVPQEVTKPVYFIREYHDWQWMEKTEGKNSFEPTWQNFNFDTYYKNCKEAGHEVCPAIQKTVPWMNTFREKWDMEYKPVGQGKDSSKPESYKEYAEHVFQFAARYGKTKVNDSQLKVYQDNVKWPVPNQKKSGLCYLNWVEVWNEPDKWWKSKEGFFTPFEYAAMFSAAVDGHKGAMGKTAGIKTADPTMKVALSGVACERVDYAKGIKLWFDKYRGDFPADAINVHIYCNNGADQRKSTVGVSPEEGKLKQKVAEWVDFRDKFLPDVEVWVSEFGYDTSEGSPQRAPATGSTSREEMQARWLVRSFLILIAAGVDKAIMYNIKDESATNGRFSTSGLITTLKEGRKKASWYYVYTLKKQLEGLKFTREVKSGNKDVMIYEFKGKGRGAYAVWNKTSEDKVISNFVIDLPFDAKTIKIKALKNGSTEGEPGSFKIHGKDSIQMKVTEKPQFITWETDEKKYKEFV